MDPERVTVIPHGAPDPPDLRRIGRPAPGGLAELGRAWFAGRNRAGAAVYDRARGCVYDGIDAGRVSANAGAEAGIEAGLTLLGASRGEPQGQGVSGS